MRLVSLYNGLNTGLWILFVLALFLLEIVFLTGVFFSPVLLNKERQIPPSRRALGRKTRRSHSVKFESVVSESKKVWGRAASQLL